MASPKRQMTYSSRPTHAARAAHAKGAAQFKTYDTSYIRPKKSKTPLIVGIIVAVVAAAIVAVLALKFTGVIGSTNEALVPEGEVVSVAIPEGSGAKAIGQLLFDAGLINSVSEFNHAVESAKASSSLQAGNYKLPGGMTADEMVAALVKGPGLDGVSFTIPEGFKLVDIAARVEDVSEGRISAEDFLAQAGDASAYAKDYSFLANAGTNSLEGFLFPKTYALADDATADSVIRMMLDQFRSEVASLDYRYPSSVVLADGTEGLDNYQVLILASIIEKESTAASRSRVAAVFYNRLTTEGEPSYGFLQSDATTAYEVGHDPSGDEVHADSPYSTYTNEGLPPTPICSPSLESLQAACNPYRDYLGEDGYFFFYFEPDGNGDTLYYFSRTLEEHEDAIAGNAEPTAL